MQSVSEVAPNDLNCIDLLSADSACCISIVVFITTARHLLAQSYAASIITGCHYDTSHKLAPYHCVAQASSRRRLTAK